MNSLLTKPSLCYMPENIEYTGCDEKYECLLYTKVFGFVKKHKLFFETFKNKNFY